MSFGLVARGLAALCAAWSVLATAHGAGAQTVDVELLLNLTGSESEGLHWDPKILKISRTVR